VDEVGGDSFSCGCEYEYLHCCCHLKPVEGMHGGGGDH
jgi:hypothetical protein